MANSMKNAGKSKAAVMDRRKYNEAISGDTMNGKSMYKKGGATKKYQPGGTTYADKIVERIASDQSTAGKYIIKPAAVAALKAAKKIGKGIEKYGPRVMEAASKLERGPKQKKGGTIKSKNK